MKNIDEVVRSYLCTGCGACVATCPKEAIQMQYSNIGRKYASINNSICVDCGLCQKTCPSYNFEEIMNRQENPFNGNIIDTFIMRSANDDLFKNAQSGGMCTTIISYLFDKKMIDAVVLCIMEYDDEPRPKGIIITEKSELYKTQKSCYTPVDVLSVLKAAVAYNSVALVGLPCHIKGAVLLSEHLKCYSNIKYKLGLVCDRTLCDGITKVFHSYTNFKKYKVNWKQKYFAKSKAFDYKNAPVVIHDESGRYKIVKNLYRFLLKDMFTAPHCRICYDKVNVFADIVLGDPWCLNNVDWVKGDSLVFVRTEKGHKLMNNIIDEGYAINVRRVDNQTALDGQFVYEREEQYPLYVNAFRKTFKTRLTEEIFGKVQFKSDPFVDSASEAFDEFIINEKLSEDDIVKKARKIITHNRITLQYDRCKYVMKRLLGFRMK